MDKSINDENRIIIGVREWTVEEVARHGWINTEDSLQEAAKLEEFVLRGITDITEYPSTLYASSGKGVKKIY